jgi:integrase
LLASLEPSFRNDKHRAQWKMTLAVYCKPIRERRVSTITTDDVLNILKPIWQEKAETASRLRGRIERVLDFAKTKGWRTGDNPALWRGHLRNVLPQRQKLTRGHHPAMPYRELPTFMERLKGNEANAARALEFLILTAARSGEVQNAEWSEIDLNEAVWTVPESRMKAGKEHRVPLTEDAVNLLERLQKERISDFVFPGKKAERPLSSSAKEMLMRRMKVSQFTVHGFRSAFRDWAGDETNFPRELAEAALAHRVGDATERAYRRADALEKRRTLMDAWAKFLSMPRGKVIPIRRQPR